jgi:hypothetical protein
MSASFRNARCSTERRCQSLHHSAVTARSPAPPPLSIAGFPPRPEKSCLVVRAGAPYQHAFRASKELVLCEDGPQRAPPTSLGRRLPRFDTLSSLCWCSSAIDDQVPFSLARREA